MSSYLRTLAARAVDQPQPIRPRLASLFEPPPGPAVRPLEVSRRKWAPRRNILPAEQRAATVVQKIDPPQPSFTQPAPPPSSAAPGREHDLKPQTNYASASRSTRLSSLDQDMVHVARPPQTQSRVDTATVVKSSKVEPVPALEPPTHFSSEVREPARTIPVTNQTEFRKRDTSAFEQTTLSESNYEPTPEFRDDAPSKPAEMEPTRLPSLAVKPATTIVPTSAEKAPTVLDTAPPSIRITIGRVDVRAIMPAAQTRIVTPSQPATKALSLAEYLQQRNGASS